jgi:hypothetical protein
MYMRMVVKRHKIRPSSELESTHIKKIAENALFGLFTPSETAPAKTERGRKRIENGRSTGTNR